MNAAPRTSPDAESVLAVTRRLADALDRRWGIPGTRWRFGFDALVGLVPGIGDTITAGFALVPVVLAARLGVRRRVIVRMAVNVVVDWIIGLVPFVDIVLDVAFKPTVRNLRLLERELQLDSH